MSRTLFNLYTRDITFILYMQTDAVVICWMSIYTKNLYDKVVIVFPLKNWKFLRLSLLGWLLTIPIGLLCPILLILDHFIEYYKVWVSLKLIVLSMNMLVFCKIFYVIINKCIESKTNFAGIMKACVISFILVCITGLHALLQCMLEHVLTYLWSPVNMTWIDACYILNSFQAIPITVIFLILTKNCN